MPETVAAVREKISARFVDFLSGRMSDEAPVLSRKPSLDALMLHLPQPLLSITPVSSPLIVLHTFSVLGR